MSEEEGKVCSNGSHKGPMAGIVFRHLEVLAFALKDPGMSVVLFDRPFPCYRHYGGPRCGCANRNKLSNTPMGLVTGQGRPECSPSRTPFEAQLTRFDGAREGAVVHAEGRVTWQTKGPAEKLGFSGTALSDACFPSMSVPLSLPLGQSPRWEALPEAITCLYLCHAQKADSSSTLWLDRAGVIRPDSPKTGQGFVQGQEAIKV